MKIYLGILFALMAAWAWPLQATMPEPEMRDFVVGVELRGPVDYVIDGDTFKMGPARIRLFGVDAPEIADRLGTTARDVLRDLIGKAEVSCVLTGKRTYDRYEAICFLEDSEIDIAKWMVRQGLAVDANTFSGGVYGTDEAMARVERKGVWLYAPIPRAKAAPVRVDPGLGI